MKVEEIIYKFKARIKEGKSIKYKDFKNDDSKLLYAIERKIGNLYKCAMMCGISEEDYVNKYGMRITKNTTLTEKEMKDRLNYLKSIGKLTTLAMRTEFNDLKLEQSLKRVYGSVEKGLLHFGLERDSRLVTLDSLEKEILELYNQGYDLSYKNMTENKSKILNTITKKLDLSWYEVLKNLNISVEPLKVVKYNKSEIIDKLNQLIAEHGTLNHSIMRKYESGILNLATKNYNSIYDFFKEHGFEEYTYMDDESSKFKGFKFERIFRELLDEIGINYEYNKYIANNKFRPDFILENNIILDCKLSTWTPTIKSTIENYVNYCDKLIIVYLRGEERIIENLKSDKVEFINYEFYLNKLDEKSRQRFILEFDAIINSQC